MYDFKNSFFLNFLLIHRAKYIFSGDMFCLPHFWAQIHSVTIEAILDIVHICHWIQNVFDAHWVCIWVESIKIYSLQFHTNLKLPLFLLSMFDQLYVRPTRISFRQKNATNFVIYKSLKKSRKHKISTLFQFSLLWVIFKAFHLHKGHSKTTWTIGGG